MSEDFVILYPEFTALIVGRGAAELYMAALGPSGHYFAAYAPASHRYKLPRSITAQVEWLLANDKRILAIALGLDDTYVISYATSSGKPWRRNCLWELGQHYRGLARYLRRNQYGIRVSQLHTRRSQLRLVSYHVQAVSLSLFDDECYILVQSNQGGGVEAHWNLKTPDDNEKANKWLEYHQST